jgi:hypothetical protein
MKKRKIKESFPHVRVFTWKGLIELAKFVGFKIEKVVGSGHVLGRLVKLSIKNARFITIKVKMKHAQVIEESFSKAFIGTMEMRF